MTSREAGCFQWGRLFYTESLAESKDCRDTQDMFGEGNQLNLAEIQGMHIAISGNKSY